MPREEAGSEHGYGPGSIDRFAGTNMDSWATRSRKVACLFLQYTFIYGSFFSTPQLSFLSGKKEEEDAMSVRAPKGLLVACLVLSIGFLFGCAGMEYAPNKGIAYYHSELPAADRALAAAKAAGKDKECPEAYKYADDMRNKAYKTYWECRTPEAIAQAKEAAAMAKGLCPKLPLPEPMKVTAPPPPPPMAAPTVSLMASPSSVDKGKCADLTWSSTSASAVSIDQGIGRGAGGGG